MSSPPQGGVFSVVQALQEQLASPPESGLEPEVAERALWLALSPRRSAEVPAFLKHDVIRDAKRIVHRRRTRRTRARRWILSSPECAPAAVGGHFWGQPTPEDLVVALDLEDRIREAARSAGPHGERTLDGMLVGEPARETAADLAISSRTIQRVRTAIREATRRIADLPEPT